MSRIFQQSTWTTILLLSNIAIAADQRPRLPTNADPRLTQAAQARQQVEQKEKSLAKTEEEIFHTIEAAISNISAGRVEQPQIALDGFRELCQQLRPLAADLMSRHEEYKKNVKALATAHSDALPKFRLVAETYQEYAKEETYDDLKQDYMTVAQTWLSFAKGIEEQNGKSAPNEQALGETIRYVSRTAVFLDRFEQHITILLPHSQTAAERHQYMEQLKRYIRAFEHLRHLIRAMDQELRMSALSADLRPKEVATPDASKSVADVLPSATTPSTSKTVANPAQQSDLPHSRESGVTAVPAQSPQPGAPTTAENTSAKSPPQPTAAPEHPSTTKLNKPSPSSLQDSKPDLSNQGATFHCRTIAGFSLPDSHETVPGAEAIDRNRALPSFAGFLAVPVCAGVIVAAMRRRVGAAKTDSHLSNRTRKDA
jgi:hypothetical protein